MGFTCVVVHSNQTVEIQNRIKRKFDSIIIDGILQSSLLKLCEFSTSENWNLVYRGSRDGFLAKNFHTKCDDISNTLTLIKCINGNIFGGYTEAEWNSKGVYQTDKNAFIFSLINEDNKPVKMKLIEGKEKYAISCSSNRGPCFGEKDIFISDNCNSKNSNYSNIGVTYKHPTIKNDMDSSWVFLTGSDYFYVANIEVFEKI